MPKFTLDPQTLDVSVDDFIESCTPREVEKLIDIIAEDHNDALKSCINLSPEDFLERCDTRELYETHDILHDQYDIGEDDDARSETQRRFNYYLTSLREGWYSVSKEDAEIISILAKKYGAV